MKKGLTKLSQKIGFTETEIKVIIFLLVIFSIGFGYKYFFIDKNNTVYKEFDYSKQDSIFYAAVRKDSLSNLNKINNRKRVDYKQEVLDFNKSNVDKQHKNKKIELNSADARALKSIPGIGEKTAKNIIKYRTDNNGIKKIKELLKIKGIGQIKFTKIKKYLYIEK
ncbi:MAG TPA: helix-hairpin-helix domain-containing protein [Ignavibacteria bacterium]|nr:helix-hairpin-helix domain-containing protein [Ignavibacteria bacterium]